MTEIKRRQGQRGSKPKDICPKCEKEYLQTAYIKKEKKWVRVGLCCPSPSCDYLIKDFIEMEDTEEGEEEE